MPNTAQPSTLFGDQPGSDWAVSGRDHVRVCCTAVAGWFVAGRVGLGRAPWCKFVALEMGGVSRDVERLR